MVSTLGTAANPMNVDDALAGTCHSRISIDLTAFDDEDETISPTLTVSDAKSADVGSAVDDDGRRRFERQAGCGKLSVTRTFRANKEGVNQPLLPAQTDACNKHTSSVQRSTEKDNSSSPSDKPNLHPATVIGGESQRSSSDSTSNEKAAAVRSQLHLALHNVDLTLSPRQSNSRVSTLQEHGQEIRTTAQDALNNTEHLPQLDCTLTKFSPLIAEVQGGYASPQQKSERTSAHRQLLRTLTSSTQESSTPPVRKQSQQEGISRSRAYVKAPPAQPSTEQPHPGSILPRELILNTTTAPTHTSAKLIYTSDSHNHTSLAPVDSRDDEASTTQSPFLDVEDFETAYSYVERCLSRHLDNQYQSHAITTWAAMRYQRTCHERKIRAHRRNRRFSKSQALLERQVQHTSPFTNMSSIQIPSARKSDKQNIREISQDVFLTSHKDNVIRSSWTAPPTTYKSTAKTIPPFKEYVSLRDNVLADNESKLLATPYFDDGPVEDSEDLLKDLPHKYEMRHDENALLDLRYEQCRFYQNSVNSFLGEIGITWDDVLYWLLASVQTIEQINSCLAGSDKFEAILLKRSDHHTEHFWRDGKAREAVLFDRELEKWQQFRLVLTEPTTSKLRLAALACAAVFSVCKFSIWYLAQQSEGMQVHSMRKTKCTSDISRFTYKEAVCRVCHEHNCFVHGELKQKPESDAESEGQDSQDSEDEVPAHQNDDSDLENLINYKVLSNPNPILEHASAKVVPSLSKWRLQDYITKWEETKPFVPCNHEGTCEDTRCRCYKERIPCEKTCKCSIFCSRRFPGCTCSSTSGTRVCDLDTCLCSKSSRECDADLCSRCGATEILDPVNRYNDNLLPERCSNVSIQRGIPRKTLLGNSQVHGFGLYMGEDIKRDEYIGEYTGETISNEELTRREIIAMYQNTLYSFQLNNKQSIDAMYMGNKTRFINNANEKFSNCKSRIMLCNTVFRIGLYAKCDIKAGTELFFNYNYSKKFMQGFTQPNGKLIAVRQTVNSKAKNKPSTIPSSKPHIPTSLARSSEQLSTSIISNSSRAARAAKRATQSSRKNSHVSEYIPDTEPDTGWLATNENSCRPVDATAENSDVFHLPDETSGDGNTRCKLSNQRMSAHGRSSVVAVRIQRNDEARPETRTSKRKRPIIVTSDEE